jgi:hypothetical protein
MTVDRGPDESLHVRGNRDIAAAEARAAAGPLDARGHRRPRRLVDVPQYHRRPLRCEAPGDGLTEALRRACHHHRLAVESPWDEHAPLLPFAHPPIKGANGPRRLC